MFRSSTLPFLLPVIPQLPSPHLLLQEEHLQVDLVVLLHPTSLHQVLVEAHQRPHRVCQAPAPKSDHPG